MSYGNVAHTSHVNVQDTQMFIYLWCQWLVQVQLTFIFKEALEESVI